MKQLTPEMMHFVAASKALRLIERFQPKHMDFHEWIDYLRERKPTRLHQKDWLEIIDAAYLRYVAPGG